MSLPSIVENGDVDFALDEPPRRRMEIYIAVVNSEGDAEEMAPGEPIAINSIHLCIKYGAGSNDPEKDYLPTAVAIARHLGWQIYDPQGDEIIPNAAVRPVRPKRALDG